MALLSARSKCPSLHRVGTAAGGRNREDVAGLNGDLGFAAEINRGVGTVREECVSAEGSGGSIMHTERGNGPRCLESTETRQGPQELDAAKDSVAAQMEGFGIMEVVVWRRDPPWPPLAKGGRLYFTAAGAAANGKLCAAARESAAR